MHNMKKTTFKNSSIKNFSAPMCIKSFTLKIPNQARQPDLKSYQVSASPCMYNTKNNNHGVWLPGVLHEENAQRKNI